MTSTASPDLGLSEIQTIPLEKINMPSAWTNIRLRPDSPDEFAALVDTSIRDPKSLPPILVSLNKQGEYELVQGFRRARAAKEAKRTHILARVQKEMSVADMVSANARENLNRRDLVPGEIINRIGQMASVFNVPEKEIAKELSISAHTVKAYLRIYRSGDLWGHFVSEVTLGREVPSVRRIQSLVGREDWKQLFTRFVEEKKLSEMPLVDEPAPGDEEGEEAKNDTLEGGEVIERKLSLRKADHIALCMKHAKNALKGKGKYPGSDHWNGKELPKTKAKELETALAVLRWVSKARDASHPVAAILGVHADDEGNPIVEEATEEAAE